MVLKELCLLRGVAGNEGEVRSYINDAAQKLADEVKVDRMGNVIAIKHSKKENAPTVMLDAHMDEVGMIVLGINSNGLISYDTCGGIDPRVVVSKPVLVGEDAVPGVIGAKAIHLQSAEDRKRVLGHSDLYIDIGAMDQASAERLVKSGDYISFDSEWVEFGDGMVKSKALDDRVGCYNMLRVLENEYPVNVICSFTAQEETGLRGASTVLFSAGIKPDCALALEGTTANDLGMVDSWEKVCCAGKGAVISFMDRSSIGNVALFDKVRGTAEKNGIPWQLKQKVAGGNNAGRLQTSRGPLAICSISVPCRYIHSPSSVASLRDIEAQYRLVDAFLNEFDGLN